MTPITKEERDTLRSVVSNQVIPSQYIKRIVWTEVPRLLDALDKMEGENERLQKKVDSYGIVRFTQLVVENERLKEEFEECKQKLKWAEFGEQMYVKWTHKLLQQGYEGAEKVKERLGN